MSYPMTYLDLARSILNALPSAKDTARSPGEISEISEISEKSPKASVGGALAGEVAWRLEAFCARLPTHGPIWPPRVRESALCDAPGYCSLCGDKLPTDPALRFPRCRPCVRALTLALQVTREGLTPLEASA